MLFAFLAVNSDGTGELNALLEQLGGVAAFHGRIDVKALEELVASASCSSTANSKAP